MLFVVAATQDAFNAAVEHGFQASATLQQGSIVANETGAAGQPFSTVPNCSWCMDLQPLVGWGPAPGLGNGRTNGSSFASSSSGSLTSGSSRVAVGSSSSSRRGGSQKATAGWLSALAVFEPHWQVRVLACVACVSRSSCCQTVGLTS
jgi:tocopherol cyclase